MARFFIKIKNIKLYKRRAVAIFNSLSSCTSEMEDRQEKKQGKDFEVIVKETETIGELTGNEPWILPSARIGGLQTRRIIEAGKDIARKAIKEQRNIIKEARKGVGD